MKVSLSTFVFAALLISCSSAEIPDGCYSFLEGGSVEHLHHNESAIELPLEVAKEAYGKVFGDVRSGLFWLWSDNDVRRVWLPSSNDGDDIRVKYVSKRHGHVRAVLRDFSYDPSLLCSHHHAVLDYVEKGVVVEFDLVNALEYGYGDRHGIAHNQMFNCRGVGVSFGSPGADYLCDVALPYYATFQDLRAAWTVNLVPQFEQFLTVNIKRLTRRGKI